MTRVQQLFRPELEFLWSTGEPSLGLCTCVFAERCVVTHGKESVHEDGYSTCSWDPKSRTDKHAHPSTGKKQNRLSCSAFAHGDAAHTILRGIVLQLMQLSNFYCNWKTIHHRNFMVGLGESVIYNKWWNSLSLAIWLHTKDAKCRYGHLQSNTIRSLQVGRLPRLHMAPSGNINTTEHNFLSPLWFSLSIHDIGSFIQKKQEKKLAFEKLLL